MYQLPPVIPPESLPSAVFKQKVLGLNLDPPGQINGPRSRGADLLSQFPLIELTEQMRAAKDPKHAAMVNQIRSPASENERIPFDSINSLEFLKASDLKNDPSWLLGPYIVTTNLQRHALNHLLSEVYARHHCLPRFTWKVEFKCNVELTGREKAYIYENYPQLTKTFVKGTPGFITHNINPGRGLANGTPIVYESIVLDEEDEPLEIYAQILNNDSPDFQLSRPPKYLLVSVPSADINNFNGLTMDPLRVVIPITAAGKPEKVFILAFNFYTMTKLCPL